MNAQSLFKFDDWNTIHNPYIFISESNRAKAKQRIISDNPITGINIQPKMSGQKTTP
jgi:hypothetical protein